MPTPITVTGVRLYPFDTSASGGRTLAVADVTLNGAILIKGFHVVEGRGGGLFVGFPAVKGKDGRWRDMVIPLDRGTRDLIRDRVIEAYKSGVEEG
ncbi:MAG: septation protein SpoVG family protein [Candidatus Nitrospinota bacterium M3_3B_026]